MKFPRIIAAAAVGVVVVGAVVGSAATLGNTVTKLGADVASVASCDTTVTTSWDTAYDATLGAYEVTNVTIGALDGAACANATLKVTLVGTSNNSLGEKTATVLSTDSSKVVDYSADNIIAENAANVAVVLVGP